MSVLVASVGAGFVAPKIARQHPNYNFDYEMLHIADVPVSGFVLSSDCESIAALLESVPQYFRRDLLDRYENFYSEYQRDNSVGRRESRENAKAYFDTIRTYLKNKSFLNRSDEGIRVKGRRYALYAASVIREDFYSKGCHFAEQMGVGVPLNNWEKYLRTWEELKADKEKALESGIQEEIVKTSAAVAKMQAVLLPVKARLIDDVWWIRRLIKKNDREFEAAAIQWGRVRKGKHIYVSNESLDKVIARQERSLRIMAGLIAVSDDGDELEMLDILKRSTANPMVKLAELMNRIYGFQEYAKEKEHMGEFYTFTAPSKYHANSGKYKGYTPQQVQQEYFAPMWARIRASLNDKGINVYGFRVAESHKDGCTHWHVLLFMEKKHVVEASNLLLAYAFAEDGNEKGAYLNRFDWEEIDPNKGSAVAYIIKYISKNIAGLDLGRMGDGSDIENALKKSDGKGKDGKLSEEDKATRVSAWASLWGIRQFQQIGGCSVGVWRELRRLGDKEQENETVEEARKAANKGDWKAYMEVQGGVDVPMRKQAIQIYSAPRVDKETGAEHVNKYGEVVDYIQGLKVGDCIVKTRFKVWKIEEKETEESKERNRISESSGVVESAEENMNRLLSPVDFSLDVVGEQVNYVKGVEYKGDDLVFDPALDLALDVALDLPWSSVNNCRIEPSKPIQEKDFLAKELKIEYQKRIKSGELFDVDCETFVKTLLKKL